MGFVQISLRPVFSVRVALLSKRILIDGNHFFVEKNALYFRVSSSAGHFPPVRGRCQDGPKSHVCSLLIGGKTAVADFEHIGIIPVSRSRKRRENQLLLETDFGYRLPNLRRCRPSFARDWRPSWEPIPRRFASPYWLML